jgi:hypothetical protein
MKWSPTSTFDCRAYSPEKLGSVRQEDFCNTITSTAAIFLAVLGAINRDAGADFEQTINDEVYELAVPS